MEDGFAASCTFQHILQVRLNDAKFFTYYFFVGRFEGVPLASSTPHAGPDFATFLAHATGTWQGTGYTWNQEHGHTLPPYCTKHKLQDLGDNHSIRETSLEPTSDVVLDSDGRSAGATFFSFGSWSVVPHLINAATEMPSEQFLVCIANTDGTRHKMQISTIDHQLDECNVAFEACHAAGNDNAARMPMEEQQPLVEEGQRLPESDPDFWVGATDLILVGHPEGGTPDSSIAWSLSMEERASGRGPYMVLPDDATHLPGGCWVAVRGREQGGLW